LERRVSKRKIKDKHNRREFDEKLRKWNEEKRLEAQKKIDDDWLAQTGQVIMRT